MLIIGVRKSLILNKAFSFYIGILLWTLTKLNLILIFIFVDCPHIVKKIKS